MFGLNIYLNTSLNTYLEKESGLSCFFVFDLFHSK